MEDNDDIHVPPPSYWPILLAGGLGLIAIGVITNFILSIIGIVVLLISVGGWAMENRAEDADQGADHE